MKPKIIIAGANGFTGTALIKSLKDFYEVIGLVRKPLPASQGIRSILWHEHWQTELEGAYGIINLVGRSVDCRYNEKNKKEILESRVHATNAIGDAISACTLKPKVWLNASSATIYGYSIDTPMTETSGEIGEGFSVEVCKAWEAAFYKHQQTGVRQIAMRISIILGKDAGVMKPFKNLVRFGLGGKQGPGNQIFSWMHINDFCNAVKYFLENENAKGSYNMASPNPVTNDALMATFRKIMKIPIGIPSPTWILEIGAFFLQTETELIVKSRYVIPEKLIQEGFTFQYPKLEGALENLLQD